MSKLISGRRAYLLAAGAAVFCAAMLFVVCNNEGGAPPPAGSGPYTLAVTYGVGGRVDKYPNQDEYTSGQQVTLTAVPDAGYLFSGWSGGASGVSNPLPVTVTGNMSITASFVPAGEGYTLTVNATGGGTVSKEPNKAVYSAGESVTIRAVPNADYTFSSWAGDVSSTTNPYVVTMTKNMVIGATFLAGSGPQPPTKFTVTLVPSPGGSLSKMPDKAEYDPGETVTVIATADAGLKFSCWSNAWVGVCAPNPRTVPLTQSISVGAIFELEDEPPPGGDGPFSLTININPPGSGSAIPTPTLPADGEGPVWGPYSKGTSVMIAYLANSGYDFVNWTGGGSGSFNRTVVMNADMTVTANFVPTSVGGEKYSLNLDIMPKRAGQIPAGLGVTTLPNGGLGQYSYEAGTSITVTATQSPPYVFLGWTENGVEVSSGISYNFTLNSNRNLVASFVDTTYVPPTVNTYCSYGGGATCILKTESNACVPDGEILDVCPTIAPEDNGSCDYGTGGCHPATRQYCADKKGKFHQGNTTCQ